MTFADLPDVLTPEDLRLFLKKSPNHIYDALRRGELPGRMLCGRWLTGKYELGVKLGIVSPTYSVEEEIKGLRRELRELKEGQA